MSEPLPALVNPGGGSAAAALAALRGDARFAAREVAPAALQDELRRLVDGGARRVVVAGGDGTVANAANALVGTGVALAIVPGGTLNHFARQAGIPRDVAAACDLAATGRPRPFDVGRVNGRVFVNTSSVGAYVGYVRLREWLEPWLGYWLASLVASLRIFLRLRTLHVAVEAEGRRLERRTPLVFVGVGERVLRAEWAQSPLGRAGLHVLVVRDRGKARLLALAFAAATRAARLARGTATAPEVVAPMPDVEALLVDRCTVTPSRPGRVSLDGELVMIAPPLEYEVMRGALMVVSEG